jgi:hypothetical protein
MEVVEGEERVEVEGEVEVEELPPPSAVDRTAATLLIMVSELMEAVMMGGVLGSGREVGERDKPAAEVATATALVMEFTWATFHEVGTGV